MIHFLDRAAIWRTLGASAKASRIPAAPDGFTAATPPAGERSPFGGGILVEHLK